MVGWWSHTHITSTVFFIYLFDFIDDKIHQTNKQTILSTYIFYIQFFLLKMLFWQIFSRVFHSKFLQFLSILNRFSLSNISKKTSFLGAEICFFKCLMISVKKSSGLKSDFVSHWLINVLLIICFVSMINTSISSVECTPSFDPQKHRINSKIISSNRSRNKGRFFQIFCLFSWWFCWPKKEILFRRKIPFFFVHRWCLFCLNYWVNIFCVLHFTCFFRKKFFSLSFFSSHEFLWLKFFPFNFIFLQELTHTLTHHFIFCSSTHYPLNKFFVLFWKNKLGKKILIMMLVQVTKLFL